MKLYCVRHTRPLESGVCYGHKNIAVEPFEISNPIKQVVDSSTVIFSSPSARCFDMAQGYAGGRTVKVDRRLMEINFGEWEGVPWGEIPIEQLDDWAANVSSFKPPMGESFEQLVARVGAWLAELHTNPERSCVAFTHGGVLKALRVLLLNEDFELATNYHPPFHQVVSFRVNSF